MACCHSPAAAFASASAASFSARSVAASISSSALAGAGTKRTDRARRTQTSLSLVIVVASGVDLAHQLVEVLARQPGLGRRSLHVVLVAVEERGDVRAVEREEHLLLRLLVRNRRRHAGVLGADRRRRRRCRAQVEHELGELRRWLARNRREGDGARERVAELAYVARPSVRDELLQVVAGDRIAVAELPLEEAQDE